MAKPVVLTVDDDPEVLQAVARDLRHQYGDRYRIMRADSGMTALNAVEKLKLRNESVALFLVDQRMPQMGGVEFLQKAKEIFPDAKKVLLTAYADTNAAIDSINHAKLDYYLLKPWNPPEEKLYPVLDDLLADWMAVFRPPFQGIRVVGNRWSPLSHQIKDFLARNQIPYRWLDIEGEAEAGELLEYAARDKNQCLPVVFFPDGSHATQPSNLEIANKIGLQTQAERPFYDLAIVGGGPAGLAAAVYGASEGLSTIAIEKEAPGGQAGSSSRIENYLGFPVGLSGGDLTRRAVTQARRFGVEMLAPQEVVGIDLSDSYRILKLSDGSEIACHALLIATGVSYRRLNVPGMEKLYGAGIYYGAAMTEALACKGETVYIVGGANSAGQGAMYFSKYAREVIILARSPLVKSMSQYLIDQIAETPNITVREGCVVTEVTGEDKLEAITIEDNQTQESKTVPATSLFIFIGAVPKTDWLDGIVKRDEKGFIFTGSDLKNNGKLPPNWNLDREPFLLEASVPGIFVAGDVRHGSVKRVASGVGEGSISVQFIHRYLAQL